MRILFLVTLAGIGLALASVLFWPEPRPQEGAWYVLERNDSLLVQQLVDGDSTASPMARSIVHDLLSGNLRIRIDKTGACVTLAAHYKGANAHLNVTDDPLARAFLLTRPIALYDSTARRCFAYRMTYNMPLNPPVTWYDQAIRQIPMHFVLIHPQKDFKQFRHAN